MLPVSRAGFYGDAKDLFLFRAKTTVQRDMCKGCIRSPEVKHTGKSPQNWLKYYILALFEATVLSPNRVQVAEDLQNVEEQKNIGKLRR